jgi:hypothetical protein
MIVTMIRLQLLPSKSFPIHLLSCYSIEYSLDTDRTVNKLAKRKKEMLPLWVHETLHVGTIAPWTSVGVCTSTQW